MDNNHILDEYLHVQKLRGRRPSTLRAYQLFLSRFLQTIQMPITDISTRDIRRFLMGEESRGNNRRTIATKTAMLRSFFVWLEREELIDRNPMNKIDRPKTDPPAPKYLTHEEIEQIREVARGIDRLLVEVLYSSGLRVSEAVALNWDDIDWSNKILIIRNGKGGKTRQAPLSTKAMMLLQRYREKRTDSNPWVFQSQFKRRMSKESIEHHMRKLGERAALKKRLTPHCLRHSQATHLLAAGMPIDMVQQCLGHADVKTTQVYARTQTHNIDLYYRRVFP